MNKLMRIGCSLVCLNLLACSTQVTGPVSGRKYHVEVGCTEDMKRYREQREQVVGEAPRKLTTKDIMRECSPDDDPQAAGKQDD